MAIDDILADLLREEARLTKHLQKVQAAIEGLTSEPTTEAVEVLRQKHRRGRDSAFMPAVLEFLRQRENPMATTQEIVDGLQASGFQMNAQDPYRNAAALLRREAAREDARIFRIDDQWFPASLPT